jgi:hypothetical protein
MASNDSIAQVAGLLASILRYISHKPKMITPFSVTLSTIPTPIFKKQQTPANQAERRAYWIGVRVTSMGTAAHIYLGNQNAQLIDLTTVGDYHEFAVEEYGARHCVKGDRKRGYHCWFVAYVP